MQLRKTVKSTQEQATASWINNLNELRFERLTNALQQQDQNLKQAIGTLDNTLKIIKKEIIEKNRGATKGMHGFIAEVSEVGIGNARAQIEGELPVCEWINDNGPADLNRNGIQIQQKFYKDHLSLQAIRNHSDKYPDFIKQGGKYQIPKDQYDKIKYYLSVSEKQANKMPTDTGEFSLKQWKEVHEFLDKGDIRLEDIEPSTLEYGEVQVNTHEDTFQREEESIKKTDREKRKEAYDESKPSLKQGVQVALVSAGIEGGAAMAFAIIDKRKSGKKIADFDADDWKEIIIKEGGKGALKGGIRGGAVYLLTNFTNTPASVANALCTSAFGVAELAYEYKKGEITKEEFLEKSEMVCVDAALSAVFSAIGQAAIPIPVLGAIIGNTVGMCMVRIGRDYLTHREQKLLEEYVNDFYEIDMALNAKYENCLIELNKAMQLYLDLLDRAFSPNYKAALDGSVALAMHIGVPKEELLTSVEDADRYFLG